MGISDELAKEAEELDGYFSDAPLNPEPNYPKLRETFETGIVITNLPKVPEAKLEKLTKVVVRLASRIGNLAVDEESGFTGVHMPYDKEKDTTMGFCFVEYETPEEAKNAVDVLQGYSFDKKHQLAVASYTRAKELQSLKTSDFEAPKPPEFQEKPNAMEWLEDPNQRDSFVLRFQNETVVSWFDARNDPVVDYDGSREKEAGVSWCEFYCYWSPAGSYLATLVPSKGVILWSGKNYEKTGRFVAPGVRHVLFSPQENYLLTNNEDPNDPAAIKVYHVPTGNLLRAFSLYPDNKVIKTDGGPPPPPPPFQWSHDDKFLARMGDGLISIFETPSMRLLDKKSLLAEGIHEFHWNPKKNVLAYWVRSILCLLFFSSFCSFNRLTLTSSIWVALQAPEGKNAPAHVDLVAIPSRKQLRQKNLFNVTKCNMVFSPSGDYLAVKVCMNVYMLFLT